MYTQFLQIVNPAGKLRELVFCCLGFAVGPFTGRLSAEE